MRTLEERIKFDYGLSIGHNLVKFTHEGNEKIAIVRIGERGGVWCLTQPGSGDMYSSWWQVKGDTTDTRGGGVIVWGARDPELIKMFDGVPVATIPLEGE